MGFKLPKLSNGIGQIGQNVIEIKEIKEIKTLPTNKRIMELFNHQSNSMVYMLYGN